MTENLHTPKGDGGHDGDGGNPFAEPRRLSILGATGTIGLNTLDLIARNRDAFDVVALTANSNADKLAALARQFDAEVAVVADEAAYGALKAALAGSGVEAAAGEAAMIEAALRPVDWTMGAIVGAAGLRPTMSALSQGTHMALANKECLVSAGDVFMREVRRRGVTLLPVDSEHAAVFQAIGANSAASVERITLTASGGPFRTWSPDKIAAAGPAQALRHPNWEMGRKISIDSATMMNKGLEIIEAFHLFSVRSDQLDIVVHPQSIVHCLVEFCDRSVLAQMSAPDMRTPIAFALGWPARMPAPTERLDLIALSRLDFEAPDLQKFPALVLARQALEEGRGMPAALNAANEVAVEAFLQGAINIPAIASVCARTLESLAQHQALSTPQSIDEVLEIDRQARILARDMLHLHAL